MQMYTIKHYKNNKKLVVESNKKKKIRKSWRLLIIILKTVPKLELICENLLLH